jgi:hypothetical protein
MEPTSTHMQAAATPQPKQAHTKANTEQQTLQKSQLSCA